MVTRFVAGDSFTAETAEARALIDGCHACAALADDIRVLRTVAADLPSPRRPRDFRLTAEQAEQLQGSPLTRLLRRLAAPGIGPLRPVAGVALSLGIVLTAVGATVPAAVPVDENQAFSTQLEAASGSDNGAGAPEKEAPAAEPGAAGGEEIAPDTARDATLRAADAAQLPTEPAVARDVFIYSGLVISLLSFAVLAFVTVARRRWRDPLLR
jgi:hypothetical protein